MNRGLIALFAVAGCVEPTVGDGAQPVINGTPVPASTFPATGALMADLGGGLGPACSGTLIAPRAVLTAGHCLDELIIGTQIPGFTLLADANQAVTADVVPGLSTHVHPSFELVQPPTDGVSQWFDIALLLLAEDVVVPELGVLPSPEEAAELVAGSAVDLVGYGLTAIDGEMVGVKHHGSADLIEVGSHELLISEPGQQQNCNGDSGGPAFVDLGSGPRLVGVVSRSPDDDPVCDHGGIDTRVDAYLEFIHDLVEIECGGLSEPCPCQGDNCDEGGGCCSSGGGVPGSVLVLGLLVAVVLRPRRRRPG